MKNALYRQMIIAIMFWLGFGILTACLNSGQKPVATESGSSFESKMDNAMAAAQQKFQGSPVTSEPSADSNFVLIKTQIKNRQGSPFATVRFFVYDLVKDEVVFEDAVARGTVVWQTESQLKVSSVPGIIRGEKNAGVQGYIYDVVKRERVAN